MAFSRRFLCDTAFKAAISVPLWMQAGLARASQNYPQPGSSLTSLAQKPRQARLVVIDPGHGGRDPGCIGSGQVYEKNIVLDTALDLNRMLQQAGYQTMMTRQSDVFVPLQDRVDFAERHRASLFVSVHANSIVANPGIRGASVYTFSPDPSDPLAAEIARSENSVETITMPAFKGVSPQVSKILFSLMSQSTKTQSVLAQQKMVGALSQQVGMLQNPARKATFAVLQSSAIPSILVETAFLSNPQDEAELRTLAFRMRLAGSMKSAIDAWFIARNHALDNI